MKVRAFVLAVFLLAAAFHGPAQEAADGGQGEAEGRLGVAAAARIGLEQVATGMTSPLAVVPEPGTRRLMVVDQAGVVRVIGGDGSLQEQPFLDLRDRLVPLDPGYDERGLLGLAFHPDYARNGKLYVRYSAPPAEGTPPGYDHLALLSELTASGPDAESAVADPGSERIILSIAEPQANHNSGSLAFGPDGYQYVSLGDGGGAGDVGPGHVADWYEATEGGNAQNIEANLLGKILRIDASVQQQQELGSYGIPPDNPFVGRTGRDEIWAYGFRNPYQMAFDEETGRLFAGDAGQELWEEVDLVEKGGNYGWNVKEGAHCFSPASPTSPPRQCPAEDAYGNRLIDPIVEHPNHKNGGPGVVIVGGRIYRGSAVPELQGRYLYGFFAREPGTPSGRLFAAAEGDGGDWQSQELAVAGGAQERLDAFLLGFGADHDGELYITTTRSMGPTETSGTVWRVTAPGG